MDRNARYGVRRALPSRLLSKVFVLVFFALLLSNSFAGAQMFNIVAGGATFPASIYKSLAFLLESETKNLTMSYTSLGSTGGKCRIVDNCATSGDTRSPLVVDFAGSDAIVTNAEYALAPDTQLYPALAGAIVVAFNVPGVTDLVLTPVVIGDIFRSCATETTCIPGWISRWDDPRIIELNPTKATQLSAAGDIKVIVRADGSGTTEVFKRSMAYFNANFSIQFAGQVGENANWPNTTVTTASGNEGVNEIIRSTPSSIGYSTLGSAADYNNPFVGVGTSFLDPTMSCEQHRQPLNAHCMRRRSTLVTTETCQARD